MFMHHQVFEVFPVQKYDYVSASFRQKYNDRQNIKSGHPLSYLPFHYQFIPRIYIYIGQ